MDGSYCLAPWIVVVDTREQTPWQFQELVAVKTVTRKKQKVRLAKPLVVRTDRTTLRTGDYSIEGHEEQFSLERKSLSDALGTFTAGRERFERELERMAAMDFAAVVMEFPEHAKIPPDRKITWTTVSESIRAWRQRYGVHFIFCRNRYFAELTAMREMRRWWNDRQEEQDDGEPITWTISDPMGKS